MRDRNFRWSLSLSCCCYCELLNCYFQDELTDMKSCDWTVQLFNLTDYIFCLQRSLSQTACSCISKRCGGTWCQSSSKLGWPEKYPVSWTTWSSRKMPPLGRTSMAGLVTRVCLSDICHSLCAADIDLSLQSLSVTLQSVSVSLQSLNVSHSASKSWLSPLSALTLQTAVPGPGLVHGTLVPPNHRPPHRVSIYWHFCIEASHWSSSYLAP